MYKRVFLILVLVFSLHLVRSAVAQETPSDDKAQKLVFVGYPDPAEFLITDVLRRVGDAYEAKHPEVRVEVEPGIGYLASRELVLEGDASAMMISEMMNEPRAYQTQHSVSGAFAEYDLKLNRFLPVAARVIRSQDKVLEEMRVGFVTNEISDEMQRFLNFLSTEEARKSINDLTQVKLVTPSDKPDKIKNVKYKRQDVELKQPILNY